jgi:uncharacterized protein YjbI with pentapeptide repeats
MSQLSRGDILDLLAGGTNFRGVNLVRADLSELELSRIDFAEANLRMADLSGADLRESTLTGCSLSGAKMERAILVGSNLVEASLIGVSLRKADLSRADLSGADLTGANLEEAHLAGAFLVGTYLNETNLGGADLSGAFLRMAQLGGSNLRAAILEAADFSHAELSGADLEGACLLSANLTGAILPSSTLVGSDLRGANLSGADLTGCNLTGARLHGIKFDGVKLDDAWADWIDANPGEGEQFRTSLEEIFVGILGRPTAQILIDGRVNDDVWAVILAHLDRYHHLHPDSDVTLKAIHRGSSSSALYLEANSEFTLAGYMAEFADIMGEGSLALFESLAAKVSTGAPDNGSSDAEPDRSIGGGLPPGSGSIHGRAVSAVTEVGLDVEVLQRSAFWTSDKAIAILTENRQIWIEVASGKSVTIRPPHGVIAGIPVVRGKLAMERTRRRPTRS